MPKKSGLGKGISALIPEVDSVEKSEENINTMKINQIEPNPNQPRKVFDMEKLQILSESIKQHGIIQPIIIKKNDNGFYTIIAGERRWRAARMANLKEVPVVVKNYDEQTITEVSLIENLQREDLNPIEEALGYKKLLNDFNLTQEEISIRLGKSRPAITNILRILNLCEPVKKLVEQLEISSGHARALLGIENKELQEQTAYLIIEKDMSVRQTENYVNQLNKRVPKDEEIEKINIVKHELETMLSNRLGTKVKINKNKNKGKIEIEFYDNETLNKIVDILRKD